MGWDDSTFPKADDPNTVGSLISYWRIVPCESCRDGVKQDYSLQSRQFDHLAKSVTDEEKLARFKKHVANRREAGKRPNIKGLVLFLSKVEKMVVISDNTGELVD